MGDQIGPEYAFLAYHLNNLPGNQVVAWIFAATGLSQIDIKEKIDNQRTQENFSRLGRLIFDARARLKSHWEVDVLHRIILTKPLFCEWISRHLNVFVS